MNYVLKLKTCPDNPAYSCVFEPPNSKQFDRTCPATVFLTSHDTDLQKHDELWEALHRFHHQAEDGQAIETGLLLPLNSWKT